MNSLNDHSKFHRLMQQSANIDHKENYSKPISEKLPREAWQIIEQLISQAIDSPVAWTEQQFKQAYNKLFACLQKHLIATDAMNAAELIAAQLMTQTCLRFSMLNAFKHDELALRQRIVLCLA